MVIKHLKVCWDGVVMIHQTQERADSDKYLKP